MALGLGLNNLGLSRGGTSEPSAPSAFTAGQWTLENPGIGSTLLVTILTLPSSGGSAITDLEYRVDGGAWTNFGAATTGEYQITGLTDAVEYDVEIRAVNVIGDGDASDLKSATPSVAVQYVSAAIGDSITAQNSFSVGSTRTSGGTGYITAYNTISNEVIRLPPGNNKAVSGRTAAQCLTAIDTDLDAAEANEAFTHVWLLCGVNSITTGSSAAGLQTTITSLLDNIVDTRGKTCFLMTITPADDVAAEPAEETVRQTVNTWIRTQDGTRSGKVIVIDMDAALNDGTNNPLPDTTADGKHPSSYGAYLMGVEAEEKLSTIYANFPIPTDYTTGNVLTNGPCAGTGGTTESGVTGVSPAGYRFRAINGSTAGRVGSKNGNDEFVVTMNISGASNQAWRLQQDVTTGFTAGDLIYGEVKIEIGDDPLGLDSLELQMQFTGTSVTDPSIAKNGGGVPADMFFNGRGTYIMRTPIIPVSGTGLTLNIWLQGGKSSGTAVSSHVVTIKGMRVIKV